MKINRAFIKGTNWALAGLISMLGFTGCERDSLVEYGTPHADYTVKGEVVNKTTGKPIKGIGIRVGYTAGPIPMYGPPSTIYIPKAIITDAKGEFKFSGTFVPDPNYTIPIYVEDIDGEENGLFQSEMTQVDFNNAKRSGKPKGWYEGEYTVTLKVNLTEIEKE